MVCQFVLNQHIPQFKEKCEKVPIKARMAEGCDDSS